MGNKNQNKCGEELAKRYHEMLSLLRRARDAWFRDGWSEGECIQDVLSEIDAYSEFDNLELEMFEKAVVPVSKRATGRTIPDLTGIEHVCEWQRGVTVTASWDRCSWCGAEKIVESFPSTTTKWACGSSIGCAHQVQSTACKQRQEQRDG